MEYKKYALMFLFGAFGSFLAFFFSSALLFRRNIIFHLFLVSDLILLSLLDPFLHFLVRERLVLGGENRSHSSEAGVGVIGLDLRAIPLGIQEESGHGTLRLIWILPFLSLPFLLLDLFFFRFLF